MNMMKGPLLKCACGKADCRLGIVVDATIPGLWLRDPHGNASLMYLDANTTVELIRRLKALLLSMTGEGL
ncbi:MAG: hypothetical protein ACPLXA_00385 [Moorellaceae bacterium]